jgi:UDP-N-acetyl-D-glucosamine dehydrogenase
VKGARVLLLGLAYKAGTSDWRESSAMIIGEPLMALGAEVRAHDSHVPADATLGPEIPRVDYSVAELEQADLVVLLVDHPDVPYDQVAAHAKLVLDTRARLRGSSFRGEVL